MLKEIERDTVSLLMPCAGPVDPRVLQSLACVVAGAWREGFKVLGCGITDRTVVQTARNKLAKAFLESPAEWSFWMDSDMVLEARTIPVMVNWAKKLDAKMMTGVYYGRMGKHQPILWSKKVESKDGKIVHANSDRYMAYPIYPTGGPPVRADAAGFGCALIHRDVFDAMKAPYFAFANYVDETGVPREASEDFYFFANARELGFKLWAAPELTCGHIGTAPVITKKDCVLDMSQLTPMKTDYVEAGK